MINNKGFVTIYIAMGVLIATSVIIAISYFPIINTVSSLKVVEKSIEPYIEDKIGLERLYGKFYENISYNEVTSFPDIGKLYEVEEKELRFRNVELGLSGTGEISFEIINKTKILVDVDFEKDPDLLPHEESYYIVDLLYEGTSILEEEYKETFTTGITIEIPETFTYNEDNGVFNYGEYTLIIRVINGNVHADISYEEQAYREIDIIENESIKRTLVIENDTSIGGNIKRYLKKNY